MPTKDSVEEDILRDIEDALDVDPITFVYEREDSGFICSQLNETGDTVAKYRLVIEFDRIE